MGKKGKLSIEQKEEILAFLKLSKDERPSPYDLADKYGVTPPAIYALWKKGSLGKGNPLDKQILKKLIPLFIQVAQANINGLDFPELSSKEQIRIGALANE